MGNHCLIRGENPISSGDVDGYEFDVLSDDEAAPTYGPPAPPPAWARARASAPACVSNLSAPLLRPNSVAGPPGAVSPPPPPPGLGVGLFSATLLRLDPPSEAGRPAGSSRVRALPCTGSGCLITRCRQVRLFPPGPSVPCCCC